MGCCTDPGNLPDSCLSVCSVGDSIGVRTVDGPSEHGERDGAHHLVRVCRPRTGDRSDPWADGSVRRAGAPVPGSGHRGGAAHRGGCGGRCGAGRSAPGLQGASSTGRPRTVRGLAGCHHAEPVAAMGARLRPARRPPGNGTGSGDPGKHATPDRRPYTTGWRI